jgi:hypothetical protein
MAEVVTISGDALASQTAPDLDLIRHFEWLLERARSGEVVCAVVAFGYADGAAGWCGKAPGHTQRRYSLLGALEVAKAEIAS